jgi:hypothetical protein
MVGLPSGRVGGIVVGMRSAEEVRRNVGSFGAAAPVEVFADLRDEGLLDPRAVVGTRRVRTVAARGGKSPADI